jgi:hypothetical protein
LLRAGRQFDPDVGAATGAIRGMGRPAVGLGDQADDRESEARATLAPGLVGAAEAIEGSLEEYGWKPCAPIGHV